MGWLVRKIKSKFKKPREMLKKQKPKLDLSSQEMEALDNYILQLELVVYNTLYSHNSFLSELKKIPEVLIPTLLSMLNEKAEELTNNHKYAIGKYDYSIIGFIYYEKQDYSTALKYFLLAGNEKHTLEALSKISENDLNKFVNNKLPELAISAKKLLKDSRNAIQLYKCIAQVYYKAHLFDKAISYFSKFIKFKLNSSLILPSMLDNIPNELVPNIITPGILAGILKRAKNNENTRFYFGAASNYFFVGYVLKTFNIIPKKTIYQRIFEPIFDVFRKFLGKKHRRDYLFYITKAIQNAILSGDTSNLEDNFLNFIPKHVLKTIIDDLRPNIPKILKKPCRLVCENILERRLNVLAFLEEKADNRISAIKYYIQSGDFEDIFRLIFIQGIKPAKEELKQLEQISLEFMKKAKLRDAPKYLAFCIALNHM